MEVKLVKSVTNLMINEYGVRRVCFMGYKVSKDNPYTFHHLKKKEHGGKEDLKNGAILTDIAHKYLHIIESRDKELYDLLNNVLWQINEQGFAPLERQLLAIDYILRIFEEKHQKDRTKSGKILIKREYKEGRIVNDGVFRTNKRH